jgi:hypothetical protein
MGGCGIDWSGSVYGQVACAVVNTVMNFQVAWSAGNLSTSQGNVTFWKLTLLHGVQIRRIGGDAPPLLFCLQCVITGATSLPLLAHGLRLSLSAVEVRTLCVQGSFSPLQQPLKQTWHDILCALASEQLPFRKAGITKDASSVTILCVLALSCSLTAVGRGGGGGWGGGGRLLGSGFSRLSVVVMTVRPPLG